MGVGFGCCCGNCDGLLCVTVKGCNSVPLVGATVTLKQGSTVVGTCTTDGTGTCCIPYTAAGTYTLVISGPAGTYYTDSTTTVALTCAVRTSTVTLLPRPGYSCFSPCPVALPDFGVISSTLVDSVYGTNTPPPILDPSPGLGVAWWVDNVNYPGNHIPAGRNEGGGLFLPAYDCPGCTRDDALGVTGISLYYGIICGIIDGAHALIMTVYFAGGVGTGCPMCRRLGPLEAGGAIREVDFALSASGPGMLQFSGVVGNNFGYDTPPGYGDQPPYASAPTITVTWTP